MEKKEGKFWTKKYFSRKFNKTKYKIQNMLLYDLSKTLKSLTDDIQIKQNRKNLKILKFDEFADLRKPSDTSKISFHETLLKPI